MSGTDTSLLELCNLIRSDLAFSTAILRIANSPLVAFPKDVTSVLQASMLLGFQRLRSVVITVGLRAYLKNSFTPLMRVCWLHSAACAILAERSADWSFSDKHFAYTGGILHDIGTVALATVMPGAYARTIERGADRPEDLLQIERELCESITARSGVRWSPPGIFRRLSSPLLRAVTIRVHAHRTQLR